MTQNAPKTVPGALPRGPEVAPRAPKCSPRASKNPPGAPTSPPRPPKYAQGVSEGPPGRHWDLKMEAQGAIWTSKWRSGDPFRPQNGGLGVRSKKFRKTMKLSTRVHNLQLEIGASTRPNVDKTKRAWGANSSKDVRSEGGEPSSNCTSIFLNIQTSIGRRGSAGVAKRLELFFENFKIYF